MDRTKLYVYVWGILVAFTIIEVLTLLAPLTHTVIIAAVITVASVKAIAVVSIYQHLKDEPTSVKMFPLTLLILLIVFLLLALLIAMPNMMVQ
ncbi:MAG: hypothetical protein A3K61_07685 [Thaumarchaeota archaeon RBG_16_49_8]|nr:MAG: hypothetical protein A3K61_07685 [Thaumarchaeota archaeon RBG_16_49_8]